MNIDQIPNDSDHLREKFTTRRWRAVLLAVVAAVVTSVALVAASPPVAAGPGACRSGDTGCLAGRDTSGNRAEYRLGTSDPGLGNNYYVSEACVGGCPAGNRVANNVTQMRLNSYSWSRMCRYSQVWYYPTQGWITSKGVWANTSNTLTVSVAYMNGTMC